MPTYHRDGYTGVVKVSFADIFKSTKTIREEIAAAAYKREALAARRRSSGGFHTAGTAPPRPPPHPPVQFSVPPPPPIPTQSPARAVHQAPPTPEPTVWTTDDDAQLRQLKAQNITWKGIATAMNRPVHDLKARWGIIRPYNPPPSNAGTSNTNGASRGESDGYQKAKNTRKVSFAEPTVTVEPAKASGSSGQRKLFYLSEKFTLDEVMLLNKIATKYDEEKWLRISSRFFDKTGKRITPQEAKKHVQQE
ncbi:hypothetical protein AJ80_03177 [Polytolypa hystricis UAMH7299]|uniref:Myb-like domain-containing protein n=1 Tax=Polytolypa hystricis (strain UAMH7299) TaxID=1447883 RepID=A0A2B7YKC2_POLH7|nr:hypothetical protein AJ80_03177 [Polytolypa hystricis UAMH7299]